jgi:hypothetical protein
MLPCGVFSMQVSLCGVTAPTHTSIECAPHRSLTLWNHNLCKTLRWREKKRLNVYSQLDSTQHNFLVIAWTRTKTTWKIFYINFLHTFLNLYCVNLPPLSIHNMTILECIICRPALHLWYEAQNLTAGNRDGSVGLVTRLRLDNWGNVIRLLAWASAFTQPPNQRVLGNLCPRAKRTGMWESEGITWAFLTPTPGGCEWAASGSAALTPVKDHPPLSSKYLLNRRLGGPQNLCGLWRKENALACRKSNHDSWLVQPLNIAYQLCAVCKLNLCRRRITTLLSFLKSKTDSSMCVCVRP